MSPEEIFQLGRETVDGVRAELEQDVQRLAGNASNLEESLARLLSDKTPQQESECEQRRRILEYYSRLVGRARDQLRPYFGLFPDAPCAIQATAAHLEGKRTTTYYPPSATGDYPGIFELNLSQELDKAPSARHQLAYHETFPGHHLQLSLSQQLEHLTLFRRTFVVASYLEGWAKYAETLPWELGIDKDPYYELRRKQGELISSSNLMLDVGVHYHGWSREQAIAFSQREALLSEDFAAYLVDRITVTPGQTAAYAIGLATVRGLRQRAEQQAGEHFSLASFHDRVLSEGALPLTLLKERFATYG